MKTQIFTRNDIREAAKLIQQWEVVAFPTETVYGLGASALDTDAAKKIYEAKWRPSDNPLIVHVHNLKQLREVAYIDPEKEDDIKKLAQTFWPGALTIVLPKKPCIPDTVSGGLDTVAVRIPNHQSTLKLIRSAGVPIAGPSANISGKPSSTRFSHVFEDFDGKISGVIRSRSCKVGIESSVIDMSQDTPVLLRPGWVSFEALQAVLPDISLKYTGDTTIAKSPGMKYKHYSPEAQVILFEENTISQILEYQKKYLKQGKKVQVLYPEKIQNFWKDLFHILRQSDKKWYDILLIAAVSETGDGYAIMNRLRKAASEIIS